MRRQVRSIGLALLVATGVSCGDALRQTRAPVVLTINQLSAAPSGGRNANTFTSSLLSDVVVLLQTPPPCSATSPCPTYFNDLGQAVIAMTPKNADIAPTSMNQVTITRYHVEFIRADGRNTPGVDVPYAFDGTTTATIPPTGTAQIGFEMVRHTAKLESPLAQLASNLNIIYTIARVTFYGTDVAGNDISVTGSMSVDFGNFSDQ